MIDKIFLENGYLKEEEIVFFESDKEEIAFEYSVYLAKNNNEMYIVTSHIGSDVAKMKKGIIEWEKEILYFINYDKKYDEKYKQDKEYIRININLLVILKQEDINKYENEIYDIEKSSNVVRKMFLFEDDKGDIVNKNILPFYFDETILENEIEPQENKKLAEGFINEHTVNSLKLEEYNFDKVNSIIERLIQDEE